MLKVEKANISDYDEIIEFSNRAFGIDFRAVVPKIYSGRPANSEYHYIIRDNGRIVSSVLFYPGTYNICGTGLKTCGIGTVSTAPEYRNKGLMSMIFDVAKDEISRCDIAFLAGQRQRYENFGFYPSGLSRRFNVNNRNLVNVSAAVSLSPLKTESKFLSAACALNNKQDCYVFRSEKDIFDILSPHNHEAYAVIKDNGFAGYLTFNKNDNYISEIKTRYAAEALKTLFDLLGLKYVTIKTPVTDSLINAQLGGFAENASITHCCNIRINNYAKVFQAFLKLKNTIMPLDDGKLNLSIGNNNFYIRVQDGNVEAGQGFLESAANLSMDNKQAHDLLAGISGFTVPVYKNWFPLPLYIPDCDNV